MSEQKPEKPFLDELFEDLEKRYKSPSPETIAGQVERFERLLNGALLPFVGINAFLLGSLTYRSQVGSAVVPIALAGVLAIGWLALFPRDARRTAWLHLGGLATLALMALLAVPDPMVALALGFAWTIALTAAVLREALPEKAIILYVVYLPLLVSADTPVWARIAFELATLVPMAAAFLASRRRVASLATLASAAVTGTLELSRIGQGNLGLAALMGAFLIAAAVYEWRIPKAQASSLRDFAGHGLTMLLAFVATTTLLDPGKPLAWWVWASLTALFQVVQMIRERLADPTRAAWVALAFALCLWTQAPDLEWHMKVFGTLGLAAALHAAASAMRRRFVATLALALAFSSTFAVLPKSSQQVSLHVAAACALLVAFLLMAARARPGPESTPWWRGFLRGEHADWVRRLSLGVLAQVLRVPFLATLFSWLRSGFVWLKYLKGGAEAFSLSDLTFAASHALAALFITNQLHMLLAPETAPSGLGLLILGAVWVPWGLGLVVFGSSRNVLYHRLLGTAFLGFPLALELLAGRTADEWVVALLAIVTGLAMWLTGATTRRLWERAARAPGG